MTLVLSSLFRRTNDVFITHNIKFADDTTVLGLIRNNDESAYREEVQHLAAWCASNNLVLGTKTKELIVDFRKSKASIHTPIHINGAEVERVTNFKFLGVHISQDLSWSLNTSTLIKKAQQRLFFLRKLKKAGLSPQILRNFYRCTVESIPHPVLHGVVWELHDG